MKFRVETFVILAAIAVSMTLFVGAWGTPIYMLFVPPFGEGAAVWYAYIVFMIVVLSPIAYFVVTKWADRRRGNS